MKKISKFLSIASGCYSYISITSDKSVVIEGCKSISECSDVLVIVGTTEFTVEVYGADMKLRNFNQDSVEINGRISSVNLVGKKRGECI